MQDHATALLCLASTIHHSIPFPRTFAFRRHRLYWIHHDTPTAAVATGGRREPAETNTWPSTPPSSRRGYIMIYPHALHREHEQAR